MPRVLKGLSGCRAIDRQREHYTPAAWASENMPSYRPCVFKTEAPSIYARERPCFVRQAFRGELGGDLRQGPLLGLDGPARKAREHPVIDTPPLGYFRVFDLRGSLGRRNATVQPACLYDVDRCR